MPLDLIHLPRNFSIEIYTNEVPGARSLAVGHKGTVFVGTRKEGDGRVYAVVDAGAEGRRVFVIARGLDMPNGVAFRDGALYVAESHRILRFDNIESHLTTPPAPVVVSEDFPPSAVHGWKFIRFGPDGKLYIPIGAPCNVCQQYGYALITRMNADGTQHEVYAEGVRNTVGFDWQPMTQALWFTENGRDMLGDDVPADELNTASGAGLHFGFPYCHAGDIPDPEFGKLFPCNVYQPPALKLGAHVAPLGMRFYTGMMFPPEYKNQIFIAEHGSWNRSQKVGYRVTRVRLKDNKAIEYEPFAEGWLQGEAFWGRPVDLLVMSDGAMLVSDDYAGAIYRIRYNPPTLLMPENLPPPHAE